MGAKEAKQGAAKRFLGRLWRYIGDSRGLVNTTDLIVASGATIILAAGVASVSLAGIDQAKLGKAQPDAQALGAAIQNFFKDTGKWPGQAEVADSISSNAATAKFLTTDVSGTLPSFATSVFSTGTASCSKNSLEGFAGGSTTITGASQPTGGSTPSSSLFLNINDYLVRKPNATKYPNWRGPYMQAEITSDPFGRVWLVNTMPLYCAEDVSADTSSSGTNTAGNLGYAWIYTGGPNRTLTTGLTSAKLDPDGDDAGVNLGKLVKKSTSSGF